MADVSQNLAALQTFNQAENIYISSFQANSPLAVKNDGHPHISSFPGNMKKRASEVRFFTTWRQSFHDCSHFMRVDIKGGPAGYPKDGFPVWFDRSTGNNLHRCTDPLPCGAGQTIFLTQYNLPGPRTDHIKARQHPITHLYDEIHKNGEIANCNRLFFRGIIHARL